MTTLKRTLFEILLIGGLACGLAFATNAVRVTGKINVGKSYFDKGLPPGSTGKAQTQAPSPAGNLSTNAPYDSPVAKLADRSGAAAGETTDVTKPVAPEPVSRSESVESSHKGATHAANPDGTADDEEDLDAHLEHEYQDIHTPEVIEIYNDPATRYGANLFIDARPDDAFADGHIPGAIQVHAYEIERYLTPEILEQIESAEKVIVYCGGGKCEDSIFLCRDLIEFDVPYDKLYLYGGGFKAWSAREMPVDKGR
jgi:rhodanese-related sulfurtransferase